MPTLSFKFNILRVTTAGSGCQLALAYSYSILGCR